LAQIDEVANAIRAAGGNAIGVRCDVTDADSVQHAVTKTEELLGPIDLFVNKVTIEGPIEKQHWVATQDYEKFFPRAVPAGKKQRRAYAAELLGGFAQKAYRRPLSGEDTGMRLAALAEDTWTQPGKTFEQGVAHAMAAVLASPRFLFRLESPANTARFAEVDEYSLASRLSYFLWSTMPDDELMQLAARGELRKNLAAQVRRMLADPRAENLAQNFTGQWLQARDVEGIASNPRGSRPASFSSAHDCTIRAPSTNASISCSLNINGGKSKPAFNT